MNTQSKKAKGRNFQKQIASKIRETFGLGEDDVIWRSMGASGEDIILSEKARKIFPFSIETKKQETIGIWKAIQQCLENCKDYIPLVIFSKNREKTWVALPFDEFIKIYSELQMYKNSTQALGMKMMNEYLPKDYRNIIENESSDYLNNFENELDWDKSEQ